MVSIVEFVAPVGHISDVPTRPIVHQQLGVSPFLGEGALRVVPQIPPGQPSVAGSNIRLGNGAIDASATRLTANAYRTRLTLHGLRLQSVEIAVGHATVSSRVSASAAPSVLWPR